MRYENENKEYRLAFNKNGRAGYCARVTIPPSILRDLDLSAGDYIKYTPIEGGYKITKAVQSNG